MREISSLGDEMRQFFEENNPYALEEIGRQLLEAAGRGLWDADLPRRSMGSRMHISIWGAGSRMGDVTGIGRAGSIDVVTAENVSVWKEKMGAVLGETCPEVRFPNR